MFDFMQLLLKILSGLTNRVDPDQTAPKGAVRSGSTLFAHATLSEVLMYTILGHKKETFGTDKSWS